MTNFYDDKPNQLGNDIPRRQKLTRLATISGIIMVFIALISVGIYAGLKVLQSPASTPSSFEIDNEFSKLSATATSACVAFIDEFPGTPCPPSEDTDFSALATQVCFSFIEEFPGTPCPP